jgi:hypothetical protein
MCQFGFFAILYNYVTLKISRQKQGEFQPTIYISYLFTYITLAMSHNPLDRQRTNSIKKQSFFIFALYQTATTVAFQYNSILQYVRK